MHAVDAMTFNTSETDSTIRAPGTAYAADVNNDGVPDIIEDTLQFQNQLNVRDSNGGGTLRNGFSYTFPFQYQSTTLMATGDLNGGGKVDIVAIMAGTAQVAFFLGNGDGTFKAPQYPTVLPSGIIFANSPVVFADFGTFGAARLVHNGDASTNPHYKGKRATLLAAFLL